METEKPILPENDEQPQDELEETGVAADDIDAALAALASLEDVVLTDIPEDLPETASDESGELDTAEAVLVTDDVGSDKDPEQFEDNEAEPEPEPESEEFVAQADADEMLTELPPVSDLDRLYEEETDLVEQDDAEPDAEAEPVPLEPYRTPVRAETPVPLRSDVLMRGQFASVVPALLLMALGIVLTIWFGAGAEPLVIPSWFILVALVVVALFSRWLTMGHRATGSLFVALMIAGAGVPLLLLAQPDGPGVAGWPLLFTGIGIALLLTGILDRAVRGLLLPGLMIIVGSGAAYTVEMGIVPPDLLASLVTVWPLILGLAVLILVLPFFARARR